MIFCIKIINLLVSAIGGFQPASIYFIIFTINKVTQALTQASVGAGYDLIPG